MKTKNWTTISALALAVGLPAAAQPTPPELTPMQRHEASLADLRGRDELLEPAERRWMQDLPSSKLNGILQGKSLFDTPTTVVPRLPPATVSVESLRKPIPKKAKKAYDRATRFFSNVEFEKAEREFRMAISYFPDYAQAHGDLGALYVFLRRYVEAEAETRRAIELSLRNTIVYANLGWILATRGNFAEAEGSARKALEIDPGNPQAHLLLGVLLVGSVDEKSEGFRHLEMAARTLPVARERLKALGR